MKIIFEEDDINMALMALNQLKVEGVNQAGSLVAISNTLKKGKREEEEN